MLLACSRITSKLQQGEVYRVQESVRIIISNPCQDWLCLGDTIRKQIFTEICVITDKLAMLQIILES